VCATTGAWRAASRVSPSASQRWRNEALAINRYRIFPSASALHPCIASAIVLTQPATINEYVSAFVGFAPASDLRIIVAVMVDEPTVGGYFRGIVAAPVFAAVTREALRALNVAPDSAVTDIIIPVDSDTERAGS
jgi:hypothetical protein